MPDPVQHLSTESLIGDWLDHPTGRAVLIDVLARRSPDARALYAIRMLPLSTLVSLSDGVVTQEYLDLLVEAANRLIDQPSAQSATAHLFPSAPPPAPNDLQDPLVEGRFTGKTVVVAGAGPLPTLSLTSPDIESAQIASPMTYLLSDDAANVTGAILPADEGWGIA